ncbi:hypothetical protein, partial [Serratia nevei]|uniref:hypothetical protein n=1 Tax=Serratia nevei TaxID=2703794 RepID=UPI003F7E8F43
DSRRALPGSSRFFFTRVSSPLGKQTDATYSSNLKRVRSAAVQRKRRATADSRCHDGVSGRRRRLPPTFG